ncbi:glycoside hydrolase family 5 protein [Rariglobus hedericola]|uniref:Cellulase family glycosylhydrolase n=1 Tax=Rariglobus hedericola TaxID=2597822 RepID=A0A556QSF0_9BACT|nr:glycoside hydrolase family 5 protein [Rariglobus hedericola]TSJ79561.1 cellulase family glycosylhydrolase [Rariglobus hedericola]
MNTQIKPPLRRRPLSGFLFATLVAPLVALSSATAATYYQSVNQNGAGSWDILSSWNTAADGTGTAPVSINSADDYVCNGTAWVLRTPGPASTFGGKTLTLGPKTHSLLVKSGAALSTIPNLVTQNGTALKSGSNTSTLTITSYLNVSGTTLIANGTGTNNLFPLTIGTLTGAGNFNLTGGATATLKLTITDATSYTGKITLTTGKLEFLNAMSSGGALVVTTASDVILNQTVTFTGLTVAGVVKTPGTYTAASLGFTGTGSIVVRTPATWYLTTSQTGAQDWTVAYKTQWNTNTSGTGATAPSINIVDTYSVSVGSNVLRTPATSSTFTGGTLSLAGSGKLLLLGTGTAISSATKMVSTGGTIEAGTAVRNLDVDTYSRPSGTTTLSTGAGGVLNLFVGDLSGPGNFSVSGAGQFTPRIDHGNAYTGTFTVNSGATLAVQTKLASSGRLTVNTGGNVILNDWIYVTGLTVNGSVKPAGVHTAASLGFSGTGSVAVFNRDLSGPPQLFGVNFAGAEFSGFAFWQTNAAMWDYYKNKGLTLIRIPIKWERVQSVAFGAVDFTNLDALVALANARDMKIMWDLHNYNSYSGNQVGSAAVPYTALADLWTKIADRYKNEPSTYGYDLMNEPSGTLENWSAAAQVTVDAIRKVDQRNYVIVEGMSYSSANRWPNVSGSLDIKDPVGRLIYSAHSYWDYQSNPYASPAYFGSDGNYRSDDVPNPNSGINHVAPFVAWLQTRPYAHGNIGEFCVPNNYYQAGWNEALDNFLAYARDNNLSTNYWAAGNNWTTSSTVCQPQPFPGTDKPQMAVLEAYNNFDTWTNQDIGTVITAGNASYAGGTFTVQGAGWDIWNTADSFHFVHQPVSGDCTITARIVSRSATPANSVTGVMIRESLAADSKHALMSLTTNGWVDLGYRLTTAGGSGHSGGVSGITLPYWVRLVRSGNTFKGYRAADVGGAPASWVQHGATQTITMTAPTIYIGLPVCGKSGGTLSTATIDNVTVTTP